MVIRDVVLSINVFDNFFDVFLVNFCCFVKNFYVQVVIYFINFNVIKIVYSC